MPIIINDCGICGSVPRWTMGTTDLNEYTEPMIGLICGECDAHDENDHHAEINILATDADAVIKLWNRLHPGDENGDNNSKL